MIYTKERRAAAALSALMAQTQDSMVCFEFVVPVDPKEPQELIDAKLRDARVVEASTPFAKYFGFDVREDVIDRHLMDLFNNEVPDWFIDYGQEVEDRDWENIEREFWIPTRSGRFRRMRVYLQNIWTGDLLTSQWVTLRDITEEATTRKALEENEQRQALAVEALGLRSFTLNYSADDERKSHGEMTVADTPMPDWFSAVHPEDRPQLEENFRRFYRGETERLHGLFRVLQPNGQDLWYESWAVASERNEQGLPTIINGVVLDRTEIKAMENRLMVNHRLESLGVMAGGIAHDFNNLLTSIVGGIEMLRLKDPESQEELRLMDLAAEQAAQLCQQLLTYAGRGTTQFEALELNALTSNMTELLSVGVATDARIHLHQASQACWVNGDRSQLGQVVMNLVNNASDALEDKPGDIELKIEQKSVDTAGLEQYHLGEQLGEGVYVSLLVKDSGKGMQLSEQEHLFDPFFSTKFTGRGLGLAVVMGVVKSHNGAIGVRSTIDVGTEIEVLLPLHEAPATASEEPTQAKVGSYRGSVLVVDDEPEVRSIAARYLKRLGLECNEVGCGQDAIDAFQAQPDKFDLVILDVTMPNMNGIEVAERLLAEDPSARIVLTSGYSDATVPDDLRSRIQFMRKPFRMSDLEERVKLALKSE